MCMLGSISVLYITHLLERKRIKLKFKNIILFVFFALFTVIIYKLINSIFKSFFSIFMWIIFITKLFELDINKGIINAFIIYVVIVISEIFSSILLVIIINLPEYFINTLAGSIICYIFFIWRFHFYINCIYTHF